MDKTHSAPRRDYNGHNLRDRPRDRKSIRAALPGIKRLLHYFAPQIQRQHHLLWVSFGALMAEIALHLLEPWTLKFVFDYVLLDREDERLPQFIQVAEPLSLLAYVLLAMLMIVSLRAMAAYYSVAGMAQAATNMLTEIRAQLFSHIQNLSLSFHHRNKSGDLLARVTSDIDRLRDTTIMAVLPLLAHSLTLLGMVIVMAWMHWELAVIAVTVIPLFLIATARLSHRIRREVRQQRQREGAMAATAAEGLGAIKLVQALSLQSHLEAEFLEHNFYSLSASVRSQKLAAALERLVELMVGVVTALVLWRGAQLVLGQVLTPGDLLVFVNYLRIAFKPLRQLAKYTGQIAKATASGERIIEILDTEPEVCDCRGAWVAPQLRGVVEFYNVSFAYDSERGILNQINLKIEPGERIALVGASGGGKSTLVSLLLRLYDPTAGQILVDGHDLRSFQIQSIRQQISVVLQDSLLFAASVRENIAYGATNVSETDIIKAAKMAQAHDFILQLPQGYDTCLAERGVSLSGGQRQRIAIARAAVRRSPILILDEPTTGLDQHSEHEVGEALEILMQGRTTFWISHNLNAIRQADRIVYIDHGTILEQGSHEQLMRLGGRYAALVALQNALPVEI